ncbi:MAG: M20 family metallopeptidase, partial [Saprospiraceae bacterium]
MDVTLLNIIKEKAHTLLPEIIALRRTLHMYPELSFEESNTAKLISAKLTEAGIDHTTGWAGHGIVAHIKGRSEHVIALRGDMDALPIQEEGESIYKSKVTGVMHACGHDAHTASLLGAALILHHIKDRLPHSVRLIFQPGEELLPGGAHLMIKQGVLSDPEPQFIVGQHVFPSMQVGKVGIKSDLYMASADEIYITITGAGGHAAMPQDAADIILAASQMIISLQQVVSRKNNPAIPTVLSFGKINTTGGATNILPSELKIEGTFRTMDEDWRAKAHELISNIAKSTCTTYGAHCEIKILKGYPCVVNEPKLTKKIRQSMESYLGVENVVDLPIRMTSEDFGFYSKVIPACFYRVGTGNPAKGITAPVHTPIFDIDEDALSIGMGLM